MVGDMVAERMRGTDAVARGAQARDLCARTDVERLLLIQAPDDVCVERVLGRRIDPRTGAIYHLRSSPPPPSLRVDTVRRRLQVYHAALGVVLPHFRGRIQARCTGVAEVAAAVAARMAEAAPRPAAAAPGRQRGQCAVCYDAPADYLCAPCGHQCGCERCLADPHPPPRGGAVAEVRRADGNIAHTGIAHPVTNSVAHTVTNSVAHIFTNNVAHAVTDS
eukprot:gene22336-63425_t